MSETNRTPYTPDPSVQPIVAVPYLGQRTPFHGYTVPSVLSQPQRCFVCGQPSTAYATDANGNSGDWFCERHTPFRVHCPGCRCNDSNSTQRRPQASASPAPSTATDVRAQLTALPDGVLEMVWAYTLRLFPKRPLDVQQRWALRMLESAYRGNFPIWYEPEIAALRAALEAQ